MRLPDWAGTAGPYAASQLRERVVDEVASALPRVEISSGSTGETGQDRHAVGGQQ